VDLSRFQRPGPFIFWLFKSSKAIALWKQKVIYSVFDAQSTIESWAQTFVDSQQVPRLIFLSPVGNPVPTILAKSLLHMFSQRTQFFLQLSIRYTRVWIKTMELSVTKPVSSLVYVQLHDFITSMNRSGSWRKVLEHCLQLNYFNLQQNTVCIENNET
jgi:hypothetical protein